LSDHHPTSFVTASLAFLDDFARLVRDGQRAAATLEMHRLHVTYLGATIPPETDVASIDAAAVYSAAEHEGRGRTGRPIKSVTLSKRVATLSLVLAFAHRRGWRGPPPPMPSFRRLYTPRTEHLRDAGELERLCAALPVDEADWVRISALLGPHPGDVHRLRAYDDVDPFGRPPWWRRRNTKNRRPELRLVLPAPLAARLRERFRERDLKPGDPVVPVWNKDARSKKLRRVCARLGLLVRRASDLRRTAGSWAAHELRSLTVGIKDWLGHSNLETFSRVYAHALPPALDEVARAITRVARAPRRSPKRKGLPTMVAGKRKAG
jgi:integrase